jgi:hypothetical protein
MKLPKSPKAISKLLLRVAFGGAIALVGLSHYIELTEFSSMVSAGLGPFTPLGNLWAYILPALMIIGGVLMVMDKRHDIAAWCAGGALASIAVGMLIKPVLGDATLGDVMPAVNNAFIWLIVYVLTVKWSMCNE